VRRSRLVVCLAVAFALVGPGLAQGAPEDPNFVFTPAASPIPPQIPPPAGHLEAPCGIAVDSKGSFYVSDYYHHAVDVFTGAHGYLTQIANVDPEDGPCGLAVDPAGELYVNFYHRHVTRYTPSAYPIVPAGSYGTGTQIDATEPTGIATDPIGGDLYVNQRTRIAHYDSTGALLGYLGEAGIDDGYGVAISRYPPTAGYLYIPDARDGVLEIYDPAIDPEEPIDVLEGPSEGFISLRDSSVAVDRVSGEVYVSDAIGPKEVERPEATIHVFSASGAYEGHLKYNVIDAHPVGLAVDNSPTSTQGRVYVTSGNTEGASVYAYPPGAATTAAPICAPGGFCGGAGGGGGGGGGVSLSTPASPEAKANQAPSATTSEVTQKGSVRVAVSGRFSPRRLPRKGAAPISVLVGGQISSTDGARAPRLKSLSIELNRHGQIDHEGLPICAYEAIQPASTQRALSACRPALVGEGNFEAEITLAGQEPYPTKGKLLVFNGRSKGKPVLFGQIYAARPFATSFVIVFAIKKLTKGAYGTELSAELPHAMGSWGNLTAIQMRLSRRYSYKGARYSYLSAGCPAPTGFDQVSFPLARASFGFEEGKILSSVLTRSCRARG
jgi:hypothetical protein